MIIERLELVDFRNYREAVFVPAAGTTLVVGDNGQGKTNLVEAVAYLGTLTSFRGAPPEALVRVGATEAVLRAEVRDDDGRRSLIEAALAPAGRNRVQVNRQRLPRARDLLGVVRVSVFSPDDLTLVKGGTGRPSALPRRHARRPRREVRRQPPRARPHRAPAQRPACARRAADSTTTRHGRWTSGTPSWSRWGSASGTPAPRSSSAPSRSSSRPTASWPRRPPAIGLSYDPPWRRSGLAAALADARRDDLRRGVSTVGPHRDELTLTIGGLPARTHASQGEQRTLALALRLGAHRLVAERTGSVPVLVLDDVLSELDPARAAALLGHLPGGQIVITTAGPLPAAAAPERVLRVEAGTVAEPVAQVGAS